MIVLAILLALAQPFGDPFGWHLTSPDGETVDLVCFARNRSPKPIKSEFREWCDPMVKFIEVTSRETPEVLVLSLYDSRLRKIELRFPRAVEPVEPESGP